ncbi:PAAR domain-containing protein [Cupriavidus sp. amp6]|uniref:PAAR domain-containing protein n=1 Tax=Cupriavidus sp. amp6 TaxID=388051 RepID=UPI00350F429C
MADIRYPLKNGDKTSTVGILIATGRSVLHHGTTVGVEGDYASCPACKSGGEVRNDCYPAFDIEGKQILVSGARGVLRMFNPSNRASVAREFHRRSQPPRCRLFVPISSLQDHRGHRI